MFLFSIIKMIVNVSIQQNMSMNVFSFYHMLNCHKIQWSHFTEKNNTFTVHTIQLPDIQIQGRPKWNERTIVGKVLNDRNFNIQRCGVWNNANICLVYLIF